MSIKTDLIKREYASWRKKNYQDNRGFFPIFSGFEKYFKELSPGAISLYIYFGMKSNNSFGYSYFSLNRISKDFNKTPRTISNWTQELVDVGLIYREQKKLNSVTITYLIPYD
mgnify:CR=1 FL=1